MIWACRDAPAIPFIRVPDASEGAIQKAADIGALGIIVPMVSTAEKIKAAVKYAFYPPMGERSQGRRSVSRGLGQRLPPDHQRQPLDRRHDRDGDRH